MFREITCVVVSLALLGVGQSQATVINFDTLGDHEVVTNQYPEATFSSNPGYVNVAHPTDLGSSLPNILCTAPVGGGVDCGHDTILDFTVPVNDLEFLAVGVNGLGVVANVDVYESSVLSDTLDIVGRGDSSTPIPVDATGFANVTKIHIHSITDFVGIGWDDFSFQPIPEPSTLALLIMATLTLTCWRRRR